MRATTSSVSDNPSCRAQDEEEKIKDLLIGFNLFFTDFEIHLPLFLHVICCHGYAEGRYSGDEGDLQLLLQGSKTEAAT
jgi:hypothetical protein